MVNLNLIAIAALIIAALAAYFVISKVIKTAFKIFLFLAILAALYFFFFRKFI